MDYDNDIPINIPPDTVHMAFPSTMTTTAPPGQDAQQSTLLTKPPPYRQYKSDVPENQPMPIPIPIPVAFAVPTTEHHNTMTYQQTSSSYNQSIRKSNNDFNSNQISQLTSQGYSRGMIEGLNQNMFEFPIRTWIIDNSGSMNKADGQRLVSTSSSSNIRTVPCTRWNEMQETIEYHIQLAGLLGAPTTFRFLNAPSGGQPQEFSVADKGDDMIETDVREGKKIISHVSPGGVTPLVSHLQQIREEVMAHQQSLIAEGKRVAIIVATDGLPSNDYGVSRQKELDDFTRAMKNLEGLPIWIVIRLCTDDVSVVDFYNDLDHDLEMSIEVMDNYVGEAKEIYIKNSWINYTLPLHRMREFGFSHRIFDFLDERLLTLREVEGYCTLLFGKGSFDNIEGSETDFRGFLKAVDSIQSKEKLSWHPIRRKMKPLISLKKLKQANGIHQSCTIM